MKKQLLITLFCGLIVKPIWAGDAKAQNFGNFTGGLVSNYSSLYIQDNQVHDALNMLFDKDFGAEKRKGYSLYSTTAPVSFTNGFTYTDNSNNSWIIGIASDTIRASSGNGTFSVIIATIPTPTQSLIGAVQAFGKIYFVDQVQGVYSWEGTTTTYITGSPKGSYITQFRGRLCVGGEAVPNQNRLTLSKYLDGSTWATGSLVTDPIAFLVGLNDASDTITWLYSGYNDTLIIFKNKSIYALYGQDQDDFTIRVLNTESGCIDGRSVQVYKGTLVYLSLRGIETFDGLNATLISKKINDRLTNALVSNFNQRSVTLTTQADWQAGTISTAAYLNATSVPGDLYLDSSTVFSPLIDTSAADFTAGTFSQTAVNTTGESVKLSLTASAESIRDSHVGADSAGSGGCGTKNRSFTASASYVLNSIELRLSKVGSPGTYTFNLRSDSAGSPGAVIQAISVNMNLVTGGTPSWFKFSLSNPLPEINSGTVYWIEIVPNGSCATDYVTWWGDTIPGYNFRLYGKDYNSSGTFTSRALNTGTSPATWKWEWANFVAGSDLNGQTITYETQVSNDGSSWDTLAAVTSGNPPTSTNKQYIRYKATLTTTDTGKSPSLNEVTITGTTLRHNSGIHTSAAQDLGTTITSFGSFNVTQDLSNSGTISYQICTANNSGMAGQVCTAQTPNAFITAAVNRYLTVISSFSVTKSTQNPILKDYTLAWNEGTRRPSAASIVFDDRYWLSFARQGNSTYNDCTLILSPSLSPEGGFVWSYFDVKSGAFVNYRGSLYHFDAAPTGKVYLDNQGYNDNGAAIDAYIVTKDYAPENIIFDKIFETVWLQLEPNGNYPVNVYYYLDRNPGAFTLSNVTQNEEAGFINARIPFPIDASHQVHGRTISFKFENNSTDSQFKVFGGLMSYKMRILP